MPGYVLYMIRPLTKEDVRSLLDPALSFRDGVGGDFFVVKMSNSYVTIGPRPSDPRKLDGYRSGLRNYVRGCTARGTVPDPAALNDLVDRFVQLITVSIEPEFDLAGAAKELAFEIARRGEGFVFSERTDLLAPDGSLLAAGPRPAR